MEDISLLATKSRLGITIDLTRFPHNALADFDETFRSYWSQNL